MKQNVQRDEPAAREEKTEAPVLELTRGEMTALNGGAILRPVNRLPEINEPDHP